MALVKLVPEALVKLVPAQRHQTSLAAPRYSMIVQWDGRRAAVCARQEGQLERSRRLLEALLSGNVTK